MDPWNRRTPFELNSDLNKKNFWSNRTATFALVALFLIVVLGVSKPKTSKAKMSEKVVLKNSNGVEVHVLKVGAVLQRILVPDRVGNIADIALGFDEIAPYKDGTSPYMGAVVGRVANRIANATFTLNGHTYKLAKNNGPNCLHGGTKAYDKVDWLITHSSRNKVTLEYDSKDGEEGFPGRVSIKVTYLLREEENEMEIDMEATSDASTPLSLAQHSYFNLGGHDSGSIVDHTLVLPNAMYYTPVDEVQIPTGNISPVKGTPFDFTTPHLIGERMKDVPGEEPGGYDHNYALFNLGPDAKDKVTLSGMVSEKAQLAVTLRHPSSGRALDILTNAPGLQFYSGNFLDGKIRGKGGVLYEKYAGLCLETQGWPNAVNQKNFPNVIVHPGENYHHKVIYKFYIL